MLGIFTAVLVAVLAAFGAAMAWAGSAVAASVTTSRGREVIASLALTAVGLLSLVLALGELGPVRPLLPRMTALPGGRPSGGLPRGAMAIALGFGLMVPLAILGTLAARRPGAGAFPAEVLQERLRTVSGGSLALAGGFLLSMWSLRATWALFL